MSFSDLGKHTIKLAYVAVVPARMEALTEKKHYTPHMDKGAAQRKTRHRTHPPRASTGIFTSKAQYFTHRPWLSLRTTRHAIKHGKADRQHTTQDDVAIRVHAKAPTQALAYHRQR